MYKKPRAEKRGVSAIQRWIEKNHPGYLTIPDYGRLKGVAITTVYSWCHAQKPLPHKVIFGGRRIIHRDTPTRFVRYRKEVKHETTLGKPARIR